MVRKTEVVYKEDVRGGKGKIEFRHICPKEELLGHAAMFAHLILEPHASIGTHQHVHNTEPYYILKGNGVFVDNDGSRTEIHAGMSVPSRLARAILWRTPPTNRWNSLALW